ncbi:FAD/NAD(P)-binding domain-containing protein [Sodiomyces alkalinus F11]|uniref:FAD/NAD(P)-binding domain-containing protein n=1 Tax=Sodiomyces alkalinus (strain CBS 110278 / VKM F-3762 / F11) TaxID=1314773 RepID=A0A3N2PT27_SODAK|nr:FAD/NAD(P)-binding domain-containing protein [Sodiomyces alkalinus F11]ROT37641.1 FAD/NAD(P)-binding domain-containing protein [Sodiomyces alkalinus F11]
MAKINPATQVNHPPVLIIGAGIAGLVFAQGLRKHSIPFLVFERDTAANSRLQGWALTIHFALGRLLSMLPDDILQRLDDTQVDPRLSCDKSHSVFINLETCEYKWKLPPGYGTRKRLSRDRFRQLLLSGLEESKTLLWGKEFVGFDVDESGLPLARFADGTQYKGCLLVGADGSSSRIRGRLYDLQAAPTRPLPVMFLGTSVVVREPYIAALRALDPTLFQGCQPRTRTWMWFSVMESPDINGTASRPPEERLWKIQLCLSWLTSAAEDAEQQGGDSSAPDLSTDAARIRVMRQKAADFDPRIASVFRDAIPDDHGPVLKLRLFDWHIPSPSTGTLGAVTLVGDAAHTMSMYRGEGFNHAILDAYHLCQTAREISNAAGTEDGRWLEVREKAIRDYEGETRARGEVAVAMCRASCLEVHYWDKLSENSIVRRTGHYA